MKLQKKPLLNRKLQSYPTLQPMFCCGVLLLHLNHSLPPYTLPLRLRRRRTVLRSFSITEPRGTLFASAYSNS
jgi:hypothetical protein